MFTTILLVALTLVGLLNLILIFFVFTRDQALRKRLGVGLTGIENSGQDMKAIQNDFRKALEEVVEKDKILIQNTSNEIIKYYQATIVSMTQNYNMNAQKLGNVLNADLNKKLDSLDQTIGSQAQQVGTVFSAEVQKGLKETDKKFKDYYDSRVKELEGQIYQIINETAKNVMAKSLNSAEHQELVLASLEEARKDKFFS